jgi:type I restriction enzyme M protein
MLAAAGWAVQDYRRLDLGAAPGVAVREFPLERGAADYVLFVDRKPASETPWTEALWIYDLRTNKHFTLKRHPLTYDDLKDFITCYRPGRRHEREEGERFQAFSYEELTSRDKTNLDIFWLRDESLEDTDNLPEPDVLATEIVENLGAALEQFQNISDELEASQA